MRAYNVIARLAMCVLVAASALADDSVWNMSMPTIESPSLGTGFYTPSVTPSPFMAGRGSAGGSPSGTAGTTGSKSAAQTESRPSDTKPVASGLPRTFRNSISARDMETMDSMGLLGGLSGILSEGYGSSLYSRNSAALTAMDRTEETNRLLNRVLEKMGELKEQGGTSQHAAAPAPAVTLVSDEPEASEPSGSGAGSAAAPASPRNRSRLLRFAVNGYNILRTCRTVYISDVQDDGTFLVTGDRRYMSDGQTRSETFHILFRTKLDSSSLSEYDAATAVTQDSYNPNSFVYQLSKRSNMMASRTGNLVSMRTDDPAWRLELLIDLGER